MSGRISYRHLHKTEFSSFITQSRMISPEQAKECIRSLERFHQSDKIIILHTSGEVWSDDMSIPVNSSIVIKRLPPTIKSSKPIQWIGTRSEQVSLRSNDEKEDDSTVLNHGKASNYGKGSCTETSVCRTEKEPCIGLDESKVEIDKFKNSMGIENFLFTSTSTPFPPPPPLPSSSASFSSSSSSPSSSSSSTHTEPLPPVQTTADNQYRYLYPHPCLYPYPYLYANPHHYHTLIPYTPDTWSTFPSVLNGRPKEGGRTATCEDEYSSARRKSRDRRNFSRRDGNDGRSRSRDRECSISH